MPRPFTVAVLSGKGGVGKTTICLNLARRLSDYHHTWLVDVDLFNRGATAAMFENESAIPLSVAELIVTVVAPNETESSPVAVIAAALRSNLAQLTYTPTLSVLPAARAKEGREASFLLWKGFSRSGISAHEFLRALITALAAVVPPEAIIVLDGHGGLDELSIAAALVSDVTFVVNEPDLITFTGSMTLYGEIERTARALGVEPLFQFLINRVPPSRTLEGMERDFGDVLRTISPSRVPIAAYFPLERELFGVFGDDPFVAEIYSEYWFGSKIRLLATELIEFAGQTQRLRLAEPGMAVTDGRESMRHRNRVREALSRPLYQRGDRLLIGWLVWLVLAMVVPLWSAFSGAWEPGDGVLPFLRGPEALALFAVSASWIFLSARWLRVQWIHLSNFRRLRGLSGRRLGAVRSASADLRGGLETKGKSQRLSRGLVVAGSLFALLGAAAAIVVPNFLDALDRAKQKRTMADLRNVGTAVFAWVIDHEESPDQLPCLDKLQSPLSPTSTDGRPAHIVLEAIDEITTSELAALVVPTYIKQLPHVDGWGNVFEFRLNVRRLGCTPFMAFRSPGKDGRFENATYVSGEFPPSDSGADIVWADGFFIRSPSFTPVAQE